MLRMEGGAKKLCGRQTGAVESPGRETPSRAEIPRPKDASLPGHFTAPALTA